VRTVVPIPQRPDSARIDSVRGIPDSTRTKPRADSIQAPLAVSELPSDVRVGRPLRWTRDSLFTTGAVTLADLLERIPGITTYRTGWLASAQTASYLGDFRRIRVFRDGVEMDVLDPRNGGVPDLLSLQLWQADEVTIEEAAGEIRVHVRTWTTRNTTAYTRVDIATGDEDTNLYRGYYGKRWGNGLALQVGAQQYGTGTRNRLGGGGDALNAMLRLGWARGRWSVDGLYVRLDRTRDLTVSVDGDSLLTPFQGRRNDVYLRAAYGNPDRGPWLQAIASSLTFALEGTGGMRADTAFAFTRTTATGSRPTLTVQSTDSVQVGDSAATRVQYVLTGGYTLGPVRLSLTDRVRAFRGATYNTPAVRLTYDRRWLSVSAFGEWGNVAGLTTDTARVVPRTTYPYLVGGTVTKDTLVVGDTVLTRVFADPDRISRYDVSARLTPFPWLTVIGAFSRDTRTTHLPVVSDESETDTSTVGFQGQTLPAVTVARVEGAVRLGRTWVGAGLVRRDATLLARPAVYGIVDAPLTADPTATGFTLRATGPVYKDVYVDLHAINWRSPGPYRPQYQARAELGIATNWLGRFPSGNLGIRAALIDEYRSRVRFELPQTAGTEGTLAELCAADAARCAAPSNVLTAQLEIRIQKGTLWYQLRNALNRQYELVPGFTAPRPINVYGVRWEFWN
jgi:hypothetical protein